MGARLCYLLVAPLREGGLQKYTGLPVNSLHEAGTWVSAILCVAVVGFVYWPRNPRDATMEIQAKEQARKIKALEAKKTAQDMAKWEKQQRKRKKKDPALKGAAAQAFAPDGGEQALVVAAPGDPAQSADVVAHHNMTEDVQFEINDQGMAAEAAEVDTADNEVRLPADARYSGFVVHTFQHFFPRVSFHGGVSVTRCFRPYKYRSILPMLFKLTKVCEIMVSRLLARFSGVEVDAWEAAQQRGHVNVVRRL